MIKTTYHGTVENAVRITGAVGLRRQEEVHSPWEPPPPRPQPPHAPLNHSPLLCSACAFFYSLENNNPRPLQELKDNPLTALPPKAAIPQTECGIYIGSSHLHNRLAGSRFQWYFHATLQKLQGQKVRTFKFLVAAVKGSPKIFQQLTRLQTSSYQICWCMREIKGARHEVNSHWQKQGTQDG